MPQPSDVSFFSGGHRLAATLFRTDVPSRGCVVLCQGNVGVRTYSRFSEIGHYLGDAGFTVLTFDHRGFGESEGPRGNYRPNELVEDIHAAIVFVLAATGPQCLVGLFGSGFGGGTAVMAAAENPKVGAVVALAPVSDGSRWLKGLRRYHEWRDLMRMIAADRAERVRSGESADILVDDVVIPSPRVEARRAGRGMQPGRRIKLDSVEGIIGFRPEHRATDLRAPLLVLHSECNEVVPLEEGVALYRAATGAKRLVVFPGADHHDAFEDPLFGRMRYETRIWFESYLLSGTGLSGTGPPTSDPALSET